MPAYVMAEEDLEGLSDLARKDAARKNLAYQFEGRPFRSQVHEFMEARTPAGFVFEMFTLALIVINVLCFMASTVKDFNDIYHQGLEFMEGFTAIVFTFEYAVRVYAVIEARNHENQLIYPQTCMGRLQWALTDKFSWIDVISFLPWYLDFFLNNDIPATQFIRFLRLFRMVRVEGRLLNAFETLEDIFLRSQYVFLTTGFVGFTVWLISGSLYYLTEKDNDDMIYCPTGPESCYNRFYSIPSAMYFCLMNLFGEYPLIDHHSSAGKVVASFVAIIAVAVFAIPTGILGAGFSDMMMERAEMEQDDEDDDDRLPMDLFVSLEREDLKSVLYNNLNGYSHNTTAVIWDDVMGAFIFATVIVQFCSTVDWLENHAPIAHAFRFLDAIVAIFFLMEYVLRLYAASACRRYRGFCGKLSYMFTFYALVDLFSFLPWLWYNVFFTCSPETQYLLRACSLIRVFKFERLTRAFEVFKDLLSENGEILTVTGFVAMVVWVVCGTLMYYAERFNPNPYMARYYQSIPGALWVTLLNLTGECPICDFTFWGKVVTSALGIFAVAIFSVPVGIIGAAWEDYIDNEQDKADDAMEEKEEEEDDDDGEEDYEDFDEVSMALKNTYDLVEEGVYQQMTPRQHWYCFLNAMTPNGRYFEAAVFFFILLSCLMCILETVDWFEETYHHVADMIEMVTVIFFTLEYCMRLYASPENPEYRSQRLGDTAARLNHLVSFYAVIDFVAIFPYYIGMAVPLVDRYDDDLRMLRLLRLLKMEHYIPSITLIGEVFANKKQGLFIAGVDVMVLWVIFSAMLHITEKDDFTHAPSPEQPVQAWRFRNVPNSMQYTMIHLTGDFPLIDYTIHGRIVCFAIVMCAVAVIAVPSGLVANGFTEILKDHRKDHRSVRHDAVKKIQKQLRGFVVRCKLRRIIESEVSLAKNSDFYKSEKDIARERASRAKIRCLHVIKTNGFKYTIISLIILNIVAVLTESDPYVLSYVGHLPFDVFEFFSIGIFTLEYLARLWTADLNGRYWYSRHKYATSFYGWVDLIAIGPFYLEMALIALGYQFDAATFRVSRVFRILELEHFVTAFTILGDVFGKSKHVLAATGMLALVIWIAGSTLFFLFQKDMFDNIPNSMYFTAVFLGGEWGCIDYTVPNKLLCIIFCLVAIGLFAIPTGTLFEAFGDCLTDLAELEETKRLNQEERDRAGKGSRVSTMTDCWGMFATEDDDAAADL